MIQTSFWTDAKVMDEMTPEDKYFYLYLMTNPHTKQCGCYEISKRQISNETGYNMQTIDRLIDRFENYLCVVFYSEDTKEIFLSNWHRYNWTKSPKVMSCIKKEMEDIKSAEFRHALECLCIEYGYPIDTLSIDLGEKEKQKEKQKENIDIHTPVIEYLNSKCNTKYRTTTKKTKDLINARTNEGFTLEEFKKVIDNKSAEWLGTEFEKFLRPETLFGTKFESYLNQKNITPKQQGKPNKFHNFIESDVEEGDLEAIARKRFEEKIKKLGIVTEEEK